MTARALAVEMPVPSTSAADARSWPLEAASWSARKPVGGFALLSVEQLLLPWQAHQQGLIEPLALRGYLASREMRERRCAMPPGTPTHYRTHELQALLGPAVRRSQAEAVCERLETVGLVTWTEPAIRLITHPEDLQGLDLARYAARRAHVHPLLYRVPVPRRMLRYLAMEGSPGLIATTLGVVLHCLRYYRQDKACRSGGTLSAAWLAACFGLAERTASRGLATLAALGWLATVPPPQAIRCPDGPWRVVNLAWDLPQEAPRRERAAPRRRRPVQLELFPLAGVAASDARPSGRAQAPGGDTPAPEDAAASAASQAAAVVEAREARAGTAALEAEAPAAPPAGKAVEDLEARYAALPVADQEALWAQARAHLLQHGIPPAFLIKPVVLAEVCRQLAQRGGPDAPAAVPHAVEAAPAGADGGQNLAVDDRHDGQNLAVALKELDPEPFQEIQDPEPAPRGPTGAWHAQKSTEHKATLRDVQPEDLRNLGRLLDLHHQAAMRGWVSWSEADRLHVVAAAVHAQRVGQAPCRLFVALLRDRRWEVITQDDEDTAWGWLRDSLYGPAPRKEPEAPAPPPVPAVPLSEDARFVDLAQRVLRQGGWHGEPFLAVKLQYPAWTRQRWEQAQAELAQWRQQQAPGATRAGPTRLRELWEGAASGTAGEDREYNRDTEDAG